MNHDLCSLEEFLNHSRENNLEGVNDCLSRGVDVNTKNQYGTTALMVACYAGNSAIVSRLVQVPGLDINDWDEDVVTAAHLACSQAHGRTESVRILAETGRVDWNKRNIQGYTPLSWALVGGHSDIVDIIVQQPNIYYNVKTQRGHTLAEIAVQGGDVECVETLAALESFDCWNVPDSDGNTPVMIALNREQGELVEILLGCPRVDLSCRDKDGWSLLFRAIQRKKLGEKMCQC